MLECIDLYCGAGGLSLGMRRAGLKVVAAVDLDPSCVLTYRRNFPGVRVLEQSVCNIDTKDILRGVKCESNLVVVGGPPCQLFSRLNKAPADNTKELRAYVKLVRNLQPKFVVFENVPAITSRTRAWNHLLKGLMDERYVISYGVLNALDFGLAQHRQRLIVIAGKCAVDLPTRRSRRPRTVRDVIGHLPHHSESIPNHRSMNLSKQNKKRIRSLSEGESARKKGTSFSDSYARMFWDRPAPTITTKCTSFSNGRFGHPEFDRAITVREAALLQGFPMNFIFEGPLLSQARQVGNAVPPPIGYALGKQLVEAVG